MNPLTAVHRYQEVQQMREIHDPATLAKILHEGRFLQYDTIPMQAISGAMDREAFKTRCERDVIAIDAAQAFFRIYQKSLCGPLDMDDLDDVRKVMAHVGDLCGRIEKSVDNGGR